MNGKEVQKGQIHVYVCLIHFTTIETNTALQSNWSPIKINFSKKSIYSSHFIGHTTTNYIAPMDVQVSGINHWTIIYCLPTMYSFM